MSHALQAILSSAKSAMDRGDLTTETLSVGARLGLESRSRELASALEAASPDRIRTILFTLEDMVARNEPDAAMARYSIERDISDLSDMPEWALRWAAAAFRRAEIGDGKFRPTAGELRAAAVRKVEAVRAEQYRLDAVLRAKVPPPSKPIDPEMRAKAAEQLQLAAAAFRIRDLEAERARGAGRDVLSEETEEAKALRRDARAVESPSERDAIAAFHMQHLDSRKAEFRAPLTVSPMLEKKLGIRRSGDRPEDFDQSEGG